MKQTEIDRLYQRWTDDQKLERYITSRFIRARRIVGDYTIANNPLSSGGELRIRVYEKLKGTISSMTPKYSAIITGPAGETASATSSTNTAEAIELALKQYML